MKDHICIMSIFIILLSILAVMKYSEEKYAKTKKISIDD